MGSYRSKRVLLGAMRQHIETLLLSEIPKVPLGLPDTSQYPLKPLYNIIY